MMPLNKIVLVIGVVCLALALVALFRPWENQGWMEFIYVKGVAEEIAEAVELNQEVRVRRPAGVNQTLTTLNICLPNEDPFTLQLEYSRIVLKAPATAPPS